MCPVYHHSPSHPSYIFIALWRWEKMLFHYKHPSSCDWHIKFVLMKHRDEESESRLEITFTALQRDSYGSKKYQFKTKWK